MIKRLLILIVLLLAGAWAQGQPVGIRIEGTNIVLSLSNMLSREEQKAILDQFGMGNISLDSLWQFGSLGKWGKEGWKVQQSSKNVLSIYKPVQSLSGTMNKNYRYVPNEMRNLIEQQTRSSFGINIFRKQNVVSLSNGKTRFFYEGLQNASDVYLSGTFNEWSTLATPMQRTDSGWVADLALPAGKHCYKYIIDGHWVHDLSNRQQEDDGHNGSNSIYYVYNHTFRLLGYEQAKEVVVTGSFINWDEHKLRLRKTSKGWELPVYINDGAHQYKFIVDGNWMTDPANPQVRDDGNGHINSLLTKGDTHLFTLKGFTNARQVILAGDFNRWNQDELKMQKTMNGWEFSHILPAGNYQYKFIVDGEWITDPANPYFAEQGGEKNSLFSIKPNHVFLFKNLFENSSEVRIAGNFNGWQGYSLAKNNKGWAISLYLPKGKCLYKLIVDGEWILDPTNPQWEENEFGNGNSVLWMNHFQ